MQPDDRQEIPVREDVNCPPSLPVNPMHFFSENVDRWGAAEWFNRLAMAIRDQDKACVAKDDIGFETYRMIAASSAMTLVRDHEAAVRAALSTQPASTALVERLQHLHAEQHRILGEMLLDKSEEGQAKANWQGGKVNGIAAALSASTSREGESR